MMMPLTTTYLINPFRGLALLPFIMLALSIFPGCQEDEIVVVPDNQPPQGQYVSTVQIENYIQRCFIDLLGREALDEEMDFYFNLLKTNELSSESRDAMLLDLQQDTSYRQGDSSYRHAYSQRIYSLGKGRMLESVENDYIYQEMGQLQNDLSGAINNGDSSLAAFFRERIQDAQAVLNIPKDYRLGLLTMDSMHVRLMDNLVYDQINMGTFNFVISAFDNLLYRYPTDAEYEAGYTMVEDNVSTILMGQSGTNRGDFIRIMTEGQAFYQGMIMWTFKTLLLRDPTPNELSFYIASYFIDKDFEKLQRAIMSTDEYANF
ncbi:MAG: hypothetical protein ACPGGH_00665 [Chitinophagales bacterium]